MSVPARPAPLFADIDDVARRLAETGYLPDTATATAVFLADRLGKPLLVEGPAGVGKTELARAVAQATGSGLVRLQCYEGVDEARALYEWNHAKQILRIQARTRRLGPDENRCLLRRIPAVAPAADGDPADRAHRAADRRDRQGRHRDRGHAARGAVRLRGHRAGTRHDHGRARTVRSADLERHPRAVRGAQAPLPVPAHRLPRPRSGAPNPAVAGAGTARAPGRGTRPHHRCAARHATQEAAVGGRDDRLGTHGFGARSGHHRRRVDRRHPGRGAQASVRPDQGVAGS